MNEQVNNKPHWSERAREGLKKATEMVAEHGSTVGMSGSAVLALGAGACAIMGNVSPNEMLANEWFSDGGKILIGTMVTIGGSITAEAAARKILGIEDSDDIFGSREALADQKRVASPLKGAVKVDDDPTLSPQFYEALRATLKGLEEKPDAKAALVSVLKASPEARQEFARVASGADPTPTEQSVGLTRALSQSLIDPDQGGEPSLS